MASQSKTQAVQAQVDEVVNIMNDNIRNVMRRGEELETLQNKTEDLQNSSSQFQRGATAIRKEMWWKDMKMKLILGGVVIAIIIIIIDKQTMMAPNKKKWASQQGAADWQEPADVSSSKTPARHKLVPAASHQVPDAVDPVYSSSSAEQIQQLNVGTAGPIDHNEHVAWAAAAAAAAAAEHSTGSAVLMHAEAPSSSSSTSANYSMAAYHDTTTEHHLQAPSYNQEDTNYDAANDDDDYQALPGFGERHHDHHHLSHHHYQSPAEVPFQPEYEAASSTAVAQAEDVNPVPRSLSDERLPSMRELMARCVALEYQREKPAVGVDERHEDAGNHDVGKKGAEEVDRHLVAPVATEQVIAQGSVPPLGAPADKDGSLQLEVGGGGNGAPGTWSAPRSPSGAHAGFSSSMGMPWMESYNRMNDMSMMGHGSSHHDLAQYGSSQGSEAGFHYGMHQPHQHFGSHHYGHGSEGLLSSQISPMADYAIDPRTGLYTSNSNSAGMVGVGHPGSTSPYSNDPAGQAAAAAAAAAAFIINTNGYQGPGSPTSGHHHHPHPHHYSTSPSSSSHPYRHPHHQGPTRTSSRRSRVSNSSDSNSDHHDVSHMGGEDDGDYTSSYNPRDPTPRRYLCNVCNKRFTRPSTLRTHMNSHTGERPFACPTANCGWRFTVLSNLKRHMRICPGSKKEESVHLLDGHHHHHHPSAPDGGRWPSM
ncbi:hypothetical protein HDV05_006430 [Chytridiales sp. JEL 0842]|nr:hypothetical protein HDV05_006430 [Chytridiales sp. JEL 0842]